MNRRRFCLLSLLSLSQNGIFSAPFPSKRSPPRLRTLPIVLSSFPFHESFEQDAFLEAVPFPDRFSFSTRSSGRRECPPFHRTIGPPPLVILCVQPMLLVACPSDVMLVFVPDSEQSFLLQDTPSVDAASSDFTGYSAFSESFPISLSPRQETSPFSSFARPESFRSFPQVVTSSPRLVDQMAAISSLFVLISGSLPLPIMATILPLSVDVTFSPGQWW